MGRRSFHSNVPALGRARFKRFTIFADEGISHVGDKWKSELRKEKSRRNRQAEEKGKDGCPVPPFDHQNVEKQHRRKGVEQEREFHPPGSKADDGTKDLLRNEHSKENKRCRDVNRRYACFEDPDVSISGFDNGKESKEEQPAPQEMRPLNNSLCSGGRLQTELNQVLFGIPDHRAYRRIESERMPVRASFFSCEDCRFAGWTLNAR
jgi:hypothetical protein